MLLKKLVAARVDHGRKKRAFLENGGLVLEELVASCNGRPIPIRSFSYQELILATNNFDRRLILHKDSWYTLYKGSFGGRILSIKSYNRDWPTKKDMALTDIGISAKAGAHKNIQKLVGYCLETSIPTLVFEYAQNGVLADRIYISRRQGTPMVWQSRLKIARQIAHAIAYLHTAFSRPIIHRHIKLRNIFLDQHDIPKLCDFSLSISIPEGETHVEVDQLIGTIGFICPSYYRTSTVTEKTDVYSFGMVLLQLLTGHDFSEELMDYLRNHTGVDEIGDPAIEAEEGVAGVDEIVDLAIVAEEGGAGVEQQLQAVLRLALTCIEYDPEIRPTMVDVTKELRQIERSIV